LTTTTKKCWRFFQNQREEVIEGGRKGIKREKRRKGEDSTSEASKVKEERDQLYFSLLSSLITM